MKQMTGLISIALLALAMLGCASEGDAKAQAEASFVHTQQAYTVALTGATAYMSSPRCPQPEGTICSDQSKVDAIVASIKTASVAMDQAEAALRSPTATADGASTAITAVNAALATLSAAVPAFMPGGK